MVGYRIPNAGHNTKILQIVQSPSSCSSSTVTVFPHENSNCLIPKDSVESKSFLVSSSVGLGLPSAKRSLSRELSSLSSPYFSASLKNAAVPIFRRSSSCRKNLRASLLGNFFTKRKYLKPRNPQDSSFCHPICCLRLAI